MLAVACAQAGPLAYVRGADGKWREIPARQENGRVTISLTPAEIPSGRATIVINKPDWMKLDDEGAPMLLSVRVGDTGVATDGALDLGTFDEHIPPITIRLADDYNPLDPTSFRLDLKGLPAPPQVKAAGVGPPAKTGQFIVTLPGLSPGSYEGELVVSDLSPQANTLHVPCKLSVFGVAIPEDLSTVTVATGSAVYRIAKSARLPLIVGDGGPQVYITGQPPGALMYAREITEAKLIEDTAQRKVCRVVSAIVGDAGGKPIDKPGRFEFDLEVRRDLPCLIVKSRCFDLTADGETYVFWGWPGGDGFDTPDGHKDWCMKYEEIGEVGWVYLPSETPDKPGLGWISPLAFGESRFGTMLLYTSPTRIPTKKGEAVEMPFALMPANSAEEVAKVANQLQELGVWE